MKCEDCLINGKISMNLNVSKKNINKFPPLSYFAFLFFLSYSHTVRQEISRNVGK